MDRKQWFKPSPSKKASAKARANSYEQDSEEVYTRIKRLVPIDRVQGEIVSFSIWNDLGEILDEKGYRYFFHKNDLEDSFLPVPGTKVSFVVRLVRELVVYAGGLRRIDWSASNEKSGSWGKPLCPFCGSKHGIRYQYIPELDKEQGKAKDKTENDSSPSGKTDMTEENKTSATNLNDEGLILDTVLNVRYVEMNSPDLKEYCLVQDDKPFYEKQRIDKTEDDGAWVCASCLRGLPHKQSNEASVRADLQACDDVLELLHKNGSLLRMLPSLAIMGLLIVLVWGNQLNLTFKNSFIVYTVLAVLFVVFMICFVQRRTARLCPVLAGDNPLLYLMSGKGESIGHCVYQELVEEFVRNIKADIMITAQLGRYSEPDGKDLNKAQKAENEDRK